MAGDSRATLKCDEKRLDKGHDFGKGLFEMTLYDTCGKRISLDIRRRTHYCTQRSALIDEADEVDLESARFPRRPRYHTQYHCITLRLELSLSVGHRQKGGKGHVPRLCSTVVCAVTAMRRPLLKRIRSTVDALRQMF